MQHQDRQDVVIAPFPLLMQPLHRASWTIQRKQDSFTLSGSKAGMCLFLSRKKEHHK
ncbi:hypothetical protein ATPR_1300 [Acetobacter tropicalis NBRC 101654]|uniref:Uncharacterized protein n=1 Tax=Acetobacter tropicalis NBRC 101654 TaxID=749388 RepID=F7VD51_9PROT|nr:hypothetical protein ATPR_1300 [Acetobacter tropicalis NBRC 101654]